MSESDPKEVSCPCCHKPLYVLTKIASIWRSIGNSPIVENDSLGHFIKCPRCSKRVVMEADPALQGFGFHLSPIQRCDQIFP